MPTPYDTLNNPSQWRDEDGATPPEAWELVDDDARYYWTDSIAAPRVDHIGARELEPTLRIAYEIVTAPATGSVFLQYDAAAGGEAFLELDAEEGVPTAIALTDHETDAGTWRFAVGSSGSVAYGGLANGGVVALRQIDTTFNSELEVSSASDTLLNLRNRLLTRTGYASQLESLPPGVEALYNDFLYSAQQALHRYFKALQTERFFTYTIKPGERFYAFANNVDQASAILDPRKITGVYFEDDNQVWRPLHRGIDPVRYTHVENVGWPDSFEARDVIEIFPTPREFMKLRVRGSFGLSAFATDTDYTTIDAEPVFQYALGLAKLQKGDSDAGDPARWTGYFGQARAHVLALVSSSHQGKRYIPHMVPNPNMPQPLLVGVDE